MRKLRWSTLSADDLAAIRLRIEGDDPDAAVETVKAIYDRIQTLKRFPLQGRPGAEEGARELVLTPLPYIVVYRVTSTHVEISRIWHAAQKRN